MSVKHVKKYYEEICDQYKEMLENIKDSEQDLMNNMVDMDYVENLKKLIQPVKDNYERWSYMMFLLNQPNRKDKIPAYKRRMQKFLKDIPEDKSPDATLQENKDAIKNIKPLN